MGRRHVEMADLMLRRRADPHADEHKSAVEKEGWTSADRVGEDFGNLQHGSVPPAVWTERAGHGSTGTTGIWRVFP